jgi:hypothetical protein
MSSVNTSSQALNRLGDFSDDIGEALKQYEILREERAMNTENNLEYDLRSAKWICDKTKDSEQYSQNLYAALCNMEYQKLETMNILKEETWSCSWRYAGEVVAKMREQGDYLDWYCSSFGREYDTVSEGIVTQEIYDDLKKLGWVPLGDVDVNY